MRDLVQTWKFVLKMDGRMFGNPANIEPAKELKKKVAESREIGTDGGEPIGSATKKHGDLITWKHWVKEHLM